MKRRHKLVLLLTMLPIILIGSVLFAPAAVLAPLANLFLAEAEIRVVLVQSMQLGWRESQAEKLSVSLPGMEIDLDGVSISYRPGELLRGRLLAVQVERVDVTPQPQAAVDSGSEQSIEELLAVLSDLPITHAGIGELRFHGDPEIRASLTMNTTPLLLETRLEAPTFEDWNVALTLRADSIDDFIGSATISGDAGTALTSDFTLTAIDDNLTVDAATKVNLDPLLSLPELTGKLNGLDMTTKQLQISSSLQLNYMSRAPSLSAISVSLNAPESTLRARWMAQETDLEAQLVLPLQLEGSAGSILGDMTLSMSELHGNLRVDSASASFEGRIQAEALQLNCPDLASCRLEASTSLLAERWDAGSTNGREASLSGSVSLEVNDTAVRMRAPSMTLNLPEVHVADHHVAATFEFSELIADLTGGLSLQVEVASTRLEPGLADLALTNPQLTGRIALNAGALSSELNLSLKNPLQATLQLDQAMTATGPGAGNAILTIPEYVFTDSFNLASLVAIAGLDADLVAGSISGEARLQWQPDDAGTWQFSGPLTLRLNNLSGTVSDSFFVGLSTELNARFGSGPRLYTDELQAATLATLDVGLPLDRIDWHYGFDTGAGLYTVAQAHTELLGGSVEIAEFQYDINADQQRVDIALVELDLATIMALANYPDLQVSGTISGYIPLLLSPDGISIEQGLIGALNPGGTIQYTPANPASDNSTMELVNQALSNYQYDHFNAEVNYSESGDTQIDVSLQGMNPELENGRRINLNVSISDNIPALLRSLQASRVITERLEQRLNRQ